MFKIKLKSKGYEQEYVRTMFFMKPETRDFKIDGVTYELSNEAKMTCWRTKCHIVEMFEKFVIINQGSPIFDESSYLGIKKELVAAVKTFEKMYNVHKKKTYPEINGIIQTSFIPLINALHSNLQFHKIEMMIQDGEEVPDFRYNALEEQFCIHMEKLLTILTDYGELRKEFKIQRMLNLLKIENWTESVPMEFYLQPFKDAIDEARKEMREMSRRGLNLCRYTMRLNHEMQSLIITMVDHDVVCQWLMGDQLKRDQFCFIYEVVKRLYDSPAREKLLSMDKELCTKYIPRLTVFRTLVHMREIIMEKETFEKKQKKLKEPCYPLKEGQKPPEAEEEEKQPEPEPEPEAEAVNEEELTPEELFLKREEETKEEREQFGRFWIWDRYISEGKRGYWQEMAELMTHINDHVVEDIDDHIKMSIFKIKKQKDLDKYLDIVASMKETDNEDFLYKTMSQKKKRQDREEFKEETEA